MEYVVANLLQEFEQGKMSRRQLIQRLVIASTAASAMLAAPAPAAASSTIKAINVNHLAYLVKDYSKVRDFYAGLFGTPVTKDRGTRCSIQIGETYIQLLNSEEPNLPRIDHIALSIEPWEKPEMVSIEGAPTVAAELKRRGISLVADNDVTIKDPEGFPVQLAAKSSQTSFVRPGFRPGQ